jgi:hypothetical protein
VHVRVHVRILLRLSLHALAGAFKRDCARVPLRMHDAGLNVLAGAHVYAASYASESVPVGMHMHVLAAWYG